MKKLALAMLLAVYSASSLAHVKLTSSAPEKNSVVVNSVSTIHLAFSGDVRLARLQILDTQGGVTEVPFEKDTQERSTFDIELKSPLATNGRYLLKWSSLGGDGHVMVGTVPFELNISDQSH